MNKQEGIQIYHFARINSNFSSNCEDRLKNARNNWSFSLQCEEQLLKNRKDG